MRQSAIMLCVLAAMTAAPANAAGSGASSGLPSSSRPAVDPAAAFGAGVEALQAKDYKAAEKKFSDVLSVAPNHPEANYYMALSKIGLDKAKSAVRYLENAIKARGNFVEARERLALLKIEFSDADAAREQLSAIEDLKAGCAATGDCDDAYVARVDAAIERINKALAAPAGENTNGEAPADEAHSSLFFAPRDAGVSRYVAAVRLINQEKFKEAIDDLHAAEAIVGPHPDILNYLGYAHRKLGMMDKAQAYYADALAIDPDHKGANEYLGELYLQIGEIEKAKKQLARLDAICAYGCAEREDLARLIERREGALAAK